MSAPLHPHPPSSQCASPRRHSLGIPCAPDEPRDEGRAASCPSVVVREPRSPAPRPPCSPAPVCLRHLARLPALALPPATPPRAAALCADALLELSPPLQEPLALLEQHDESLSTMGPWRSTSSPQSALHSTHGTEPHGLSWFRPHAPMTPPSAGGEKWLPSAPPGGPTLCRWRWSTSADGPSTVSTPGAGPGSGQEWSASTLSASRPQTEGHEQGQVQGHEHDWLDDTTHFERRGAALVDRVRAEVGAAHDADEATTEETSGSPRDPARLPAPLLLFGDLEGVSFEDGTLSQTVSASAATVTAPGVFDDTAPRDTTTGDDEDFQSPGEAEPAAAALPPELLATDPTQEDVARAAAARRVVCVPLAILPSDHLTFATVRTLRFVPASAAVLKAVVHASPALTALDISAAVAVPSAGFCCLMWARALLSLDVSGTAFGDGGVAAVATLPLLQRLEMSATCVRRGGTRHLLHSSPDLVALGAGAVDVDPDVTAAIEERVWAQFE